MRELIAIRNLFWNYRSEVSPTVKKYLSAATLGGLTLRNRLIKAATAEGLTPNGVPGDELTGFHRAIGKGGAGMTTLAYCAAEADGRLHEDMMFMHEGIRAPLETLIREVKHTGAAISGQLVHCGGFTKNRQLQRSRPLAPSFGVNLLGAARGMVFCDAMSESDIRALVRSYADAASFMCSVGFDAIELHFGHGYGLCQFISPASNKRRDRYGGVLVNRMRLPLEVLAAVRLAVGDAFPIIGKISLTEGTRNGLGVDEAVEVTAMLDQAGIDGIVTSGGSSAGNPMILFRGDNILKPLLAAEANPMMRGAMRLTAPFMFKNYPYEPLYFLDHAKRVRDRVSCKIIYVGGVTTADDLAVLMREGFDFVQLGRALLIDPDMPLKMLSDENFESRCNHCNECVATIEHSDGVHCTQRDVL